MSRLFAVAALLSVQCCGCMSIADTRPDTSAILQVMGRYSMAHACPIGPNIALTNSHVVDIQPFNPNVPVYPMRWSQVGNPATNTVLEPLNENRRDDLVLARISPEVKAFYQLATDAPKPGDTLWWTAYDWRDKRRAFDERVMHGRVERIVAGHIIMDETTFQGSSGSCVLNADGEVVGIVSFGVRLDNPTDEVAGFVAVFGDWSIDLLQDTIAKLRASEAEEKKP